MLRLIDGGYLEANNFSNGQNQAWHETLHIGDIML